MGCFDPYSSGPGGARRLEFLLEEVLRDGFLPEPGKGTGSKTGRNMKGTEVRKWQVLEAISLKRFDSRR